MSEDGIREHCPTCAVVAQCKRTFGKYWIDKSSGGVGCKCPLTSAEHSSAVRAASDTPKPRPAPAAAPALKLVSEPARREPWEGKTYTTHRREGGVFQSRKRKISARQGTLL